MPAQNGPVRVDLKGEAEAIKRVKALPKTIIGPATRHFLEKWGETVVTFAKPKAPVNRGQLRGSLTHEEDDAVIPRWGRAGTNVDHAIFMEGGTGLLADLPGGKNTRHWPPASALAPWAASHGTTGAAVAAAIGRRGGLRPHRFLREGFEDAQHSIPNFLQQAADEIEAGVTRLYGGSP